LNEVILEKEILDLRGLIITNDKRIVLITDEPDPGRKRTKFFLKCPGGKRKIDEGEGVFQALQRELKQEVCLKNFMTNGEPILMDKGDHYSAFYIIRNVDPNEVKIDSQRKEIKSMEIMSRKNVEIEIALGNVLDIHVEVLKKILPTLPYGE
jgi:ADP-ribose pyrophosphatase YjhB (NUDIX family)